MVAATRGGRATLAGGYSGRPPSRVLVTYPGDDDAGPPVRREPVGCGCLFCVAAAGLTWAGLVAWAFWWCLFG